ncbi:hypothetical protein QE152_g15835 [Popillia japonica]|uniref:Uncharacterized protein n=1 Tax=Popillia japonica TaxID=7064 RepID=A0AAW1L6U2_POPJA
MRKSSIKQNFAVKRKLMESSSSEENLEDVEYEESDDSVGTEIFEDEDIIDTEDFVLVKFTSKKATNYAIGVIKKILDGSEFNVNFLKKSNNSCSFTYPEPPDIADVVKNIIMKLPIPRKSNATKRASFFGQI